MKKTAIFIITAAVLSLIMCSCGGKTPENGTTTSPTTAQQYIATVPSGADIFDETDKTANGQTVAPNEPYDRDVSGNNNGDKTAATSGNSTVTAAKSPDKTSASDPTVKATATKAAVTTSAKTEKANIYDPAMPDIF
ncbi:MAG: hypothetical protein UH824_09350 [Acutalibacteraceae bacterium]|nr:hypothetical protein [Acutalibacteraceae bacterium]